MSNETPTSINQPKRIVHGVGPQPALIAIVGEAPGSEEARQGEPFVGPSGKLLNDCLHAIGILRQNCYITNVIKEQPYRNNIKPFLDLTGKKVIESDAYLRYRAILKEELLDTNPNVAVAVGAVALYALTGKRGIQSWRGSILESTLVPGLKVLPILHPAYALRIYTARHFIMFDLKKVLRESTTPDLPVDDRTYILRPSFAQSIDYLERCTRADRVAFDIEVGHGQVSCISFALSAQDAISIPFVEGSSEYFPVQQEAAIWKLCADILENPEIEKVAQNAFFDSSFLHNRYGIRTRNLHDTMIASAILYPDFPKGLGFITSIYTEMPYYKDEGKEKIYGKGGSDLTFWLYNAKDSIVLMEALPKMLQDLERQGNMETYEKQRALLEPLLFMSARGLRMDAEGLKEQSTKAQLRIEEIEQEVRQITGKDFNLRSPKQLKEYFYIDQGIKPYVEKGKPSTNENALKRLSYNKNQEVAKVARLIMEHRELAKMDGTYYQVKLDEDGRLRCSMNPVGTRMGRLSSSKTIFGTGANLQNQPYLMKKYMLPDEGYVVYDVDLGQAENRVVALLSGDPKMLQAFQQGEDIHKLTASLIFGKPLEEISTEKGSSPVGSGQYSERDIGKRANHGLNYQMSARRASLLWEIPEAEAKYIIEKYFQAYPFVRQWHAAIEEKLRKERVMENLYGRKYRFWDRFDYSLVKAATAFVPQSTIADKINRDGVLPLYYDQETYGKAEFLLQVHDSIVFQIPLSVPWEQHAWMLINLKASLEAPLTYKDRSIIIPAEFTLKPKNFLEGQDLDPVFFESATAIDDLAAYLEESYHTLTKG